MSIESRFRKGNILVSDSHHTIAIYSHTTSDTGALFFLASLINNGEYIAYTSTGVGYTTNYRPAKKSEKAKMIERLKEDKIKLIYLDPSALDSLVIIDTFNSVLSDNYALEIINSEKYGMNVGITINSYDLFKNSTKLFKDIKPYSIISLLASVRFGGSSHLQLQEIFEIDL